MNTETKSLPGTNCDSFYVAFGIDPFGKDDLISNGSYSMRVLTKPKRKWYLVLLQYLTFNIYRAPWMYKLERINNGR